MENILRVVICDFVGKNKKTGVCKNQISSTKD